VFVSDAQIQDDLSAILKKADASALQPWQVKLVARLHVAAYNKIVSSLAARGYALSQILAWDEGADYERSIALAMILQAAGVPEGMDAKQVSALDWRPKLATVDLTIAGVFQPPTGTAGLVGTGQADLRVPRALRERGWRGGCEDWDCD
jgi:hypothetical protein